MPEPGPSATGPAGLPPAAIFSLRVVSAVILAPLAVALRPISAGWPFAVFWGVAAAAVLWEWIRLVEGPLWIIAGIGYAAVLVHRAGGVACRCRVRISCHSAFVRDRVVDRHPRLFRRPRHWRTEIDAGGQPEKNLGRRCRWHRLARSCHRDAGWRVGLTLCRSRGDCRCRAWLLSVMAQLGDLLESLDQAPLRRQGRKPLIPGHGGVMDRLDGFWAAAWLACRDRVDARRNGCRRARTAAMVSA